MLSEKCDDGEGVERLQEAFDLSHMDIRVTVVFELFEEALSKVDSEDPLFTGEYNEFLLTPQSLLFLHSLSLLFSAMSNLDCSAEEISLARRLGRQRGEALRALLIPNPRYERVLSYYDEFMGKGQSISGEIIAPLGVLEEASKISTDYMDRLFALKALGDEFQDLCGEGGAVARVRDLILKDVLAYSSEKEIADFFGGFRPISFLVMFIREFMGILLPDELKDELPDVMGNETKGMFRVLNNLDFSDSDGPICEDIVSFKKVVLEESETNLKMFLSCKLLIAYLKEILPLFLLQDLEDDSVEDFVVRIYFLSSLRNIYPLEERDTETTGNMRKGLSLLPNPLDIPDESDRHKEIFARILQEIKESDKPAARLTETEKEEINIYLKVGENETEDSILVKYDAFLREAYNNNILDKIYKVIMVLADLVKVEYEVLAGEGGEEETL